MSKDFRELLGAIRTASTVLKQSPLEVRPDLSASLSQERELRRAAYELAILLPGLLEAGQSTSSVVDSATPTEGDASVDVPSLSNAPQTAHILHELKKITEPVISVLDMISDLVHAESTPESGSACLLSAKAQLELALESAGISSISLDFAEKSNRQWVVDVIPTSDPAIHGTLAEKYRHGYEWRGMVLRPQTVALFRYDGD